MAAAVDGTLMSATSMWVKDGGLVLGAPMPLKIVNENINSYL